jgi:prepilin-type N-terminal cleavage/methylation domain-containing protein
LASIMKMKNRFGFTLAELLIALAILGEIATFTIPKIISAQQNGKKKTVFRETIAALAEAQHLALIQGELSKSTNVSQAILPKLNFVKVCSSNSLTEGCWTQGWTGPWSEDQRTGGILSNGATVAGINSSVQASGTDAFIFDWNGASPPNVEGDDQLFLIFCFDKSGSGYSVYCTRSSTQDYIDYMNAGSAAAHRTLWQWIFSN